MIKIKKDINKIVGIMLFYFKRIHLGISNDINEIMLVRSSKTYKTIWFYFINLELKKIEIHKDCFYKNKYINKIFKLNF